MSTTSLSSDFTPPQVPSQAPVSMSISNAALFSGGVPHVYSLPPGMQPQALSQFQMAQQQQQQHPALTQTSLQPNNSEMGVASSTFTQPSRVGVDGVKLEPFDPQQQLFSGTSPNSSDIGNATASESSAVTSDANAVGNFWYPSGGEINKNGAQLLSKDVFLTSGSTPRPGLVSDSMPSSPMMGSLSPTSTTTNLTGELNKMSLFSGTSQSSVTLNQQIPAPPQTQQQEQHIFHQHQSSHTQQQLQPQGSFVQQHQYQHQSNAQQPDGVFQYNSSAAFAAQTSGVSGKSVPTSGSNNEVGGDGLASTASNEASPTLSLNEDLMLQSMSVQMMHDSYYLHPNLSRDDPRNDMTSFVFLPSAIEYGDTTLSPSASGGSDGGMSPR
ncbi:hypothetical protein BGW42_007095 [Actinomortierella wolfii]|nr:hypothetical protein BGW42_007095 [Actinomortierella wolfii]